MAHTRTLYIVLFFMMAVIWGMTWPLYVVALRSFSPMLIAGLRNILAATVLLILLRIQRIPLPRTFTDWRFLFLLGMVWIAIPYAMVFWGIQYTSSGMASVLNGTNPFFVALFSSYFLKEEKISRQKIVGLLLGFAGVILIFFDTIALERDLSVLADFLIFIAASFTGLAMVLAKRFGSGYHSAMLIGVMMACGGSVLTVTSVILEQPVRFHLTTESLAVLLYLGLLSSALGFVVYMWMLKRVDAVKLSMIGFVVPVIAIAAGVLWLGEKVTGTDLLGSACVMLGLFVVNRVGRRSAAQRSAVT